MENNYGGPVWHVSAAPLEGYPPSERFLRECALEALRGVGNVAFGQWEEWSGAAYHIKRRLTVDEQKQVGEPMDIRGTAEAEKRHASIVRFLPVHMRDWRE